MKLRKTSQKDNNLLISFLVHYGWKPEEACLEDNESYILEDKDSFIGFFTLKKDNKKLILQHFVVSPNYTPAMAYRLIRYAKAVTREKGYNRLIIPVKISQTWLARLLLFYTRNIPVFHQNFLYFHTGV